MDEPEDPTGCLIRASAAAAMPELRIRHAYNPASDVRVRALGRAVGLKRLAVSIARVPPGRESFVYHSHERDEEFVYILSGRGRAEIGERTFEVGPGDFMGFPTPSVAHHLTNPYAEDLVYLMAGEHSGYDLGTFPRLGKSILFTEGSIREIDHKGVRTMALDEFIADAPPAPGKGPEDEG